MDLPQGSFTDRLNQLGVDGCRRYGSFSQMTIRWYFSGSPAS